MKNLILSMFIIFFALLSGKAQVATLLDKGKAHYDKNEYREALYYFNRVIRQDSTNALVFKMRGNCYMEFNQLDSAERDYFRVLQISNEYPEAYYNLANVSIHRKDNLKAEGFMRKFLKARPDDSEALFRLSSLLKARANDSSFYYLSEAYKRDSLNAYIYATLAWEYFYKQDLAMAFRMAKASRKKFGLTNELLPLEAYAAFSLGDFNHVLRVTDTLLVRQPDEIGHHLLKTKATILSNTPRDKYVQNGFTFTLNEYSNEQKNIDSWVSDPEHIYYYPKLIKKFKDSPTEMSLPEFFMVYYGFTTDSRYSPYGIGASAMLSAAKPESAPEAMKLYRSVLDTDPFHLQTYESLASVTMELKLHTDFQKALTQYIGLMESILASGNGKSKDSAYFVISARHEYDVLAYLGLKSSMQSLYHDNGHSYDKLSTAGEDGEAMDVYFNIDKPWSSMSRQFSDKKKTNKASKSEKKKRKQ
jgi:tetratricopeptide (TPR) repeat protein